MSRTPMEAKLTRSDVFGADVQDESGRSSLNSPMYSGGYRGLANTTNPAQGYPMAIPNGITNQRPVLTAPSPMTNHPRPPGVTSRSHASANHPQHPGYPTLPAQRNFSPAPQLRTGQNHSPVSHLAGPSLTVASTAATSRPVVSSQLSGIPTSHSPNLNSLTGPQLPQVSNSAWQPNAHIGIHGNNTPPRQPSPVGPPSGHVVGSTGKTLLPESQQPPTSQQSPSSQQQPSSGPGVMPSTQASTVPLSKRRVYPSQSHGGSYPGQLYTTAAQTNSPTSRDQVPSGNVMPSLTAPNTNQLVSNQIGPAQLSPLANQMGKLNVQTESQPINLLDKSNITPPSNLETSSLSPEISKKNASQSILCCTLNNIPENNSLLQKCKLPFGILVHPFKDLSNLPVINSSSIVRCRSCRTYINPFVVFTEMRKWKCNMCYRINEVPEEFCYDTQTKSYGDPSRRPEVKSATYEFIAPSEYMLRSPQPSSYVFAFDVSFNAIETGYLKKVCDLIKANLDKMPGDSRAMIGFLTFNKNVSFYNLRNDQSQPQMFIVSDIDDIFLPSPEDLLVNLRENKEMIIQFLETLPQTFATTADTQCATGAALQAALKLLAATGGRITVFQTTLPSAGPGVLENRDEPGVKSAPKDALKLNPATDFYKKLALDCAADQVAIDVFLLSAQYGDLSSLMCASKYSGGCVSYFPNFHISKNPGMVEKFQNDLTRYLTRKIGFEAVMRVRCTKGLSIHTFHGNFFVRSTDLLSLPNVNPDSAFGMQISIEDSLTDTNFACFQSALLYTSSRGERRIRVHNMALPITKKMSDVYAGANVNAIALMLSKMAVDRSLTASLGDAREALLNAVVDFVGVYKSVVSAHSGQLLVPNSLRLLPLYVLALLKQTAFRLGCTASLDVRCFAMQQFKVMPFNVALLTIYPALYSIHNMTDEGAISTKNGTVPQPPRLVLSGEQLSRKGVFLMDAGQEFFIWVGRETSDADIQNLFGVPNYNSIPEDMWSLPDLDNWLSQKVRIFIDHLLSERTNHCNLHVLRDNSKMRMKFVNKLMNDRTESMMSYHEFMIHIQGQIH